MKLVFVFAVLAILLTRSQGLYSLFGVKEINRRAYILPVSHFSPYQESGMAQPYRQYICQFATFVLVVLSYWYDFLLGLNVFDFVFNISLFSILISFSDKYIPISIG